jgi:hypothetical protein
MYKGITWSKIEEYGLVLILADSHNARAALILFGERG